MRINDVLFAFPSILLALVFVTLLGGGTWNVIIALGIAFIPSFARIVRGEFIRCKNMDYVRSAKLAEREICELCLSISCPIPYRCFCLQS